MNEVKSFLEKNKAYRPKIVVLGDCMIDQYYAIRVLKLNPEFPTQCLFSNVENCYDSIPGGSSNIPFQSKFFNVDVFLIALLDQNSKRVYDSHGLNIEYSVMMTNGSVPVKKRFYDGDFPIFRWDVEKENYGESEIEIYRQQVLENFKFLLEQKIDCVILSDYTKGFFTQELAQEIIDLCNYFKIKTIVDPKCLNSNKWKNCTVFKPNANYTKDFCKSVLKSDKKFDEEAKFIKKIVECSEVIITDSGNGIYLQEKYLTFEELSKKRPSIRSTIGGGDEFALFLALGLSHGFTLEESSKIAYNASTVYIQDKHNKPITPYNLLKWVDPIEAKLITVDELKCVVDSNRDKKWIMTNGCFDFGLTKGHIECLKFSKQQGDNLIVAINSDESVKELKGEDRPVLPLKDRMLIVASLEFVDFVVSFNEKTPIEVVEKLLPDALVKGGDYKVIDVAGHEITKVIIFPTIESMSTTDKINVLKNVNKI